MNSEQGSLIIDIGMKILHPAVGAICKSPLSVLAVSSEQRSLIIDH